MVLKNFSMIRGLKFGFEAPVRNFALFAQVAVIYLAYLALLLLVIFLLGGNLNLNVSLNELAQSTIKSYITNIQTPIGILLYVINFLTLAYLGAGLTNIGIKIVREKPVSISDLFLSLARVFNYLLTTICYMLLIFVGYILLIIPGYYFTYKYLFAPMASIDFNTGVKKSFEISKNITFGAKLKLFFANFFTVICLGGIMALLSVILLKNFGQAFSAIVIILLAVYVFISYLLSIVHIYKQLVSQEPSFQ